MNENEFIEAMRFQIDRSIFASLTATEPQQKSGDLTPEEMLNKLRNDIRSRWRKETQDEKDQRRYLDKPSRESDWPIFSFFGPSRSSSDREYMVKTNEKTQEVEVLEGTDVLVAFIHELEQAWRKDAKRNS